MTVQPRQPSADADAPLAPAVEALLVELQRDIPRLRRDPNRFAERFEDRACRIFEIEDSERVFERLTMMLRDAGHG